jgi:hypothetical protein
MFNSVQYVVLFFYINLYTIAYIRASDVNDNLLSLYKITVKVAVRRYFGGGD